MRIVISWLCSIGLERKELVLEVFALRQQVLILQRTHPRPRLTRGDRLFWIALKRLGWLEAQPNAVPTEDGGGLATEEFPLVLTMEIATEGRETGTGSRSHEVNPEHVE